MVMTELLTTIYFSDVYKSVDAFSSQFPSHVAGIGADDVIAQCVDTTRIGYTDSVSYSGDKVMF